MRDGRDCAVSAWFHNQRVNPEQLKNRFRDLDDFVEYAAQEWKTRVERGLRFCTTRPSHCLVVQYQHLFSPPHDTLRPVLRFLGMDSTPGQLQHGIAEASFEKTSRRPPGTEDRSSFLRQGKPGNWRQHLSPESMAGSLPSPVA